MTKHNIAGDPARTDFTSALLAWYAQNARKLPWRETTDPYAIWVSEVMLQQTRVETVIPYYHRFLERYPNLTDLAAAPEEEVLKIWEGLGYYRRARLLQQGAREAVARYGGELPADPVSLESLPGVGPYMSGALASIAFNLPAPAVDGNVIRVVTRILAWEEDAFTAKSKYKISSWVRDHFPSLNKETRICSQFTQALMELGALICLPRNPRCNECPVQMCCLAVENDPERFPIKKTTREVPVEQRVALRITWNGRRILLKRPATGLLAGFWEYPNLQVKGEANAATVACLWTNEQLGRSLEFAVHSSITQIFTHRRWELAIWAAEWENEIQPLTPKAGAWLLPDEIKALPCVAFVRGLE